MSKLGQQQDKMKPTPPPGFVRALVLLGGAVAIVRFGAALNARQAREEPHGDGDGDGHGTGEGDSTGDGDGDGTGDNGTRNETLRQPLLRPAPPPDAVERENPDEGSRDLEDARGGGGGGGEGIRKDMMIPIAILVLAMQVTITVMMMSKIGSETNITALLELSLCIGIMFFVCFFIIFLVLLRLFHVFY